MHSQKYRFILVGTFLFVLLLLSVLFFHPTRVEATNQHKQLFTQHEGVLVAAQNVLLSGSLPLTGDFDYRWTGNIKEGITSDTYLIELRKWSYDQFMGASHWVYCLDQHLNVLPQSNYKAISFTSYGTLSREQQAKISAALQLLQNKSSFEAISPEEITNIQKLIWNISNGNGEQIPLEAPRINDLMYKIDENGKTLMISFDYTGNSITYNNVYAPYVEEHQKKVKINIPLADKPESFLQGQPFKVTAYSEPFTNYLVFISNTDSQPVISPFLKEGSFHLHHTDSLEIKPDRTIIIDKKWKPWNSSGNDQSVAPPENYSFTFNLYHWKDGRYHLMDTLVYPGQKSFTNLWPGRYKVTEVIPPGSDYELASLIGPSDSSTYSVSSLAFWEGVIPASTKLFQSIKITATNYELKGELVVEKKVTPHKSDGTLFRFRVRQKNASGEIIEEFSLKANETKKMTLDFGAYYVEEIETEGYLTVDYNGSVTLGQQNRSARVVVTNTKEEDPPGTDPPGTDPPGTNPPGTDTPVPLITIEEETPLSDPDLPVPEPRIPFGFPKIPFTGDAHPLPFYIAGAALVATGIYYRMKAVKRKAAQKGKSTRQ